MEFDARMHPRPPEDTLPRLQWKEGEGVARARARWWCGWHGHCARQPKAAKRRIRPVLIAVDIKGESVATSCSRSPHYGRHPASSTSGGKSASQPSELGRERSRFPRGICTRASLADALSCRRRRSCFLVPDLPPTTLACSFFLPRSFLPPRSLLVYMTVSNGKKEKEETGRYMHTRTYTHTYIHTHLATPVPSTQPRRGSRVLWRSAAATGFRSKRSVGQEHVEWDWSCRCSPPAFACCCCCGECYHEAFIETGIQVRGTRVAAASSCRNRLSPRSLSPSLEALLSDGKKRSKTRR